MANSVQVQADISTLSIQGLGAFSTILATLSADNVAPMALIQMERLGANFHISGQFAGRVPDMLSRFGTQPLGRLAAVIGWRKGDSASLLAQTAGGQAAALLSVSLANLFWPSQFGQILSQLCSRLLPSEFSVASVPQLADTAKMLAQKLFPLGFGNFLPDQVVRIHHVYQSLGVEAPIDLLDSLTVDATIDLLYSVCQALREDEKIVRISGSFAMGHILGLLLFMFWHDTVVTVEDIVIHQGERQNIHVELRKDPPGPVSVTVENVVNKSMPFYSSMRIQNQEAHGFQNQYRVAWQGFIAKGIELAFLGVGSVCTQEILVTFCNLLVAVVNTECDASLWLESGHSPLNRMATLLEPCSQLKLERACQTVLLATPTSYTLDLHTAFLAFVEKVKAALNITQVCSCIQEKCTLDSGWEFFPIERMCRINRMWSTVGRLLDAGTLCFFINGQSNTTVRFRAYKQGTSQAIIMRSLFKPRHFIPIGDLYHDVMDSFGRECPVNPLALSDGSTIYPTVFETLNLRSDSVASFELLDGKLIFEGRYHVVLLSADTQPRPTAKKSVVGERGMIKPSNVGQHENLLLTIRETMDGLETRTTARYAGTNVPLNLSKIIQASFSLNRTSPCSHPPTSPLTNTEHEAVITSVSAPLSSKEKLIAIAMTQSNPTAQLLCCEPGARMLLLQDCCLDCAFKEAVSGSYNMIIVS